MMIMEFMFDKEAVERRGYTMEKVYNHIKERFVEKNLPCIEDGEKLAFRSTGGPNDYGRMLGMMRVYSKAEWFMETASLWMFTTNERLGWEDVLAQARDRHERRKVA